MSLDVERIRKDFPIFEREVNGHPLVYLDSANTSQKPVQVLDVMRAHQERYNGNVSRSVHTLGTESTADPIDELPFRPGRRTSWPTCQGQQRLQRRPLHVGQIVPPRHR